MAQSGDGVLEIANRLEFLVDSRLPGPLSGGETLTGLLSFSGDRLPLKDADLYAFRFGRRS